MMTQLSRSHDSPLFNSYALSFVRDKYLKEVGLFVAPENGAAKLPYLTSK